MVGEGVLALLLLCLESGELVREWRVGIDDEKLVEVILGLELMLLLS